MDALTCLGAEKTPFNPDPKNNGLPSQNSPIKKD